jgi:hypothetical protein
MVTSGLHFVVLRLGAGRPTNGRVGEVHLRRHRRVRRASRFRVTEVIGGSGRWHATVRRRGPSKAGHVWTTVHAIGTVITVGRRLKRLGWSVGMRGHGPTVGRTAIAGQRRRGRSRGGPGAALGEIPTHVRRDRTAAHIVVASRAVHVQRRELTARRHRRVLRGGRGRMDGSVLGKHSFTRTSTILILPQLGLCFSRGFFDSPSVVILVPCQRRTAREGLLAVGVRTFVGSLAGVNAAMSGQRG